MSSSHKISKKPKMKTPLKNITTILKLAPNGYQSAQNIQPKYNSKTYQKNINNNNNNYLNSSNPNFNSNLLKKFKVKNILESIQKSKNEINEYDEISYHQNKSAQKTTKSFEKKGNLDLSKFDYLFEKEEKEIELRNKYEEESNSFINPLLNNNNSLNYEYNINNSIYLNNNDNEYNNYLNNTFTNNKYNNNNKNKYNNNNNNKSIKFNNKNNNINKYDLEINNNYHSNSNLNSSKNNNNNNEQLNNSNISNNLSIFNLSNINNISNINNNSSFIIYNNGLLNSNFYKNKNNLSSSNLNKSNYNNNSYSLNNSISNSINIENTDNEINFNKKYTKNNNKYNNNNFNKNSSFNNYKNYYNNKNNLPEIKKFILDNNYFLIPSNFTYKDNNKNIFNYDYIKYFKNWKISNEEKLLTEEVIDYINKLNDDKNCFKVYDEDFINKNNNKSIDDSILEDIENLKGLNNFQIKKKNPLNFSSKPFFPNSIKIPAGLKLPNGLPNGLKLQQLNQNKINKIKSEIYKNENNNNNNIENKNNDNINKESNVIINNIYKNNNVIKKSNNNNNDNNKNDNKNILIQENYIYENNNNNNKTKNNSKSKEKENNENYKNFKEIEFNNKITKTEKKLRNELLNSIKLKNTIKNYEKKQTEIKPEFNFDENKNYINNVIKNEENYLNNNKENYEKILNEIILKNLNDKQTLKNFKKNFSIQLENNLKMLNYKKVVPIEIDYSKLKEEDSKIDLNKILKIFKKKNNQNKKLNEKKNNKTNNFKLTNNLKPNDFYSTRNIVNIESNNFFFTDILNKKREENFNKKFNFQLPKLNEYNDLIKTKKDYFQTFKTNQIKKNSQSMSTSDKNRLNFNITLRNNLKRWEIDDVIDDELYI